MIPALIILLCLNSNEGIAQQGSINIADDLGNRYYDAVDYLLRNQWMADTLELQGMSPDFVYGIVFPGLVKYSAFRDVMETGATRMLYVQSGRKYSHYTIGRFQLQPYFAEMVERTAMRLKLSSTTFDMHSNAAARSERTRRLDSPEWQLKYVVLFVKIMDKRFSHINWKQPEDKLRFYATAFNVGFNRDERSLKRIMNGKTIAHRTREFKSKYRYGDVAVWFYTNDGYRFHTENATAK